MRCIPSSSSFDSWTEIFVENVLQLIKCVDLFRNACDTATKAFPEE